jgi:alpha-D-xyloside xylohydrolase
MAELTVDGNRLVRTCDGETLWIEPWGDNSLRVRATRRSEMLLTDWALLKPPALAAEITLDGQSATIKNGELTARLNREGWLTFVDARGRVLLEEYWRDRRDITRYASPLNIAGRELKANVASPSYRVTQRFEAPPGEKLFGLGQYQDAYLDKKGSVLELCHRNSQTSVPFALSNRGYGFFWHNPAVGRVTFGKNLTEWTVGASAQLDYWITAGQTPAQLEEQYTAVTGTVPMMPEHGLGFIQCKLRYRNQAELLEAAREHKRRGLPIDVIVADFFHWTIQGDWKFDPVDWPGVPAMVEELKSLGIELMVSIWPTVDTRSENFREMLDKGYLMRVDRGLRIHMNWMGETLFFDPTHPGARQFVWSKVKAHYYDQGIRLFWLDEAEPEFGIYDFDIQRYHLGPGAEVTNLYPLLYTQTFYDGLKAAGESEIVNLVRAAWAGSQRYGALVWSGDVYSSFRAMREQLAAGLSISLAGIPWWTTDIGGFHGGDPSDEAFRELVVRWFQWGAFCPVFRLHGDRIPQKPLAEPFRNGIKLFSSGADNEVWCYGEQAYPILVKYMHLRERLRPYVREQMRRAHERGTPVMRPLFYDFPEDPMAWETEDAYLFGPDILVAPILEAGARERSVYLPRGASFTHAWSGRSFEGGQTVSVPAPLDEIPIFVKDGAQLPLVG